MRLKFFNFDEIFDQTLIIDNPSHIEKGEFTDDGIFSLKIFGNLKSYIYECRCGNLKGKFKEGEICPDCNTPVIGKQSIERKGWIYLEDYYVIQPIFINFLSKVMPLNKIIDYEMNIDEEGNEIYKKTKVPYIGIGLIEFKRKFKEIYNYFKKEFYETKKKEYYEIIEKNFDNIFTNKIIVFNSRLRPAIVVAGNKMIYDEVSKFYTMILGNLRIIKENKEERFINPLLLQIQKQYEKLIDYIIDSISQKTGIIRNNLLGYRINFSSRSVIIPLPPFYKTNQIRLPYLGGMELFKFHIINLLVKTKNISYIEALKLWYEAIYSFNQEIYDILCLIIKESKPAILLNRNPTINFGSILYLEIAEIKSDINDFTAEIHNDILKPLGGDYDGDCLNIVLLIDEELKNFFKPLSPQNLIISTNDGYFEKQFSVDRDYVLGFYRLIE